MNILLLGGTRFLGRALVNALEERGHTITLLNRGQSDPAAFPHLEQIHTDRTTDLSALNGRRWDAAIDTSGYLPAVVDRSTNDFRSLEDTIQATLEWDATRPEHSWRAGLARQRETELLQKWHETRG
jgi:uncharacterized protein YbjT (DUF2867 family)